MKRRGATSRLESVGFSGLLLIPLVATPFLLGLLPDGTGGSMRPVDVEQPLAFSHKHHLAYLAGGGHRAEMVGMHLEALGLEEEDAPPSMIGCNACHDEEIPDARCVSCHDLLRDGGLRGREDARACVTCHRGAWSGAAASIPSLHVCRECHDPEDEPRSEPRFRPEEAERLDEFLRRGEDLPWIRINTMPDHVFFSHAAHVQLGAMECAACHGAMESLEDPPASVRVFTMDDCSDCHLAQGASTDCLTCHQ